MSETKTGPSAPGAATPVTNGVPMWMEGYEDLIPNLEEFVTDDGKPVDNFYVEKLYKLLIDPLYASWRPPGAPGRPFVAMSNVGWFHAPKEKPAAPDVMLSLDVEPLAPGTREGRSYFEWVYGKQPDVVIEVVSDERGDEPGEKLRPYERWSLPYYVIHDPFEVHDGGIIRAFELRGRAFAPIDHRWIEYLGLGLTMWQGTYQGITHNWLRWCDRDGKVLLTGEERAEKAEDRAEKAEDLIRRLQAQLSAAGIEPQT